MIWSFMEVHDIVFSTSLQANMLQFWRIWDDSIENVAQHVRIHLTVFNFIVHFSPCHVENVRDILEFGELGIGVLNVQDVTLDVLNRVVIGGPGWPGTAGDAIDLPRPARCVGMWQDLGEAVADDAGHTDNQSHALVLWWRIAVVRLFLQNFDQINQRVRLAIETEMNNENGF